MHHEQRVTAVCRGFCRASRSALVSMLALILVLTSPSLLNAAPVDTISTATSPVLFADEDGTSWTACGFNYGCEKWLLEDAWETSVPMIREDFEEMKQLGANVIRIHLQVGKFMKSPTETDPAALRNLGKIIDLAEAAKLRLDLTGLSCYRPSDVPKWYDPLSEEQRWQTQALFWKAVAGVGKGRKGVFCYNLMNEPVVPGEAREPKAWYSGSLLGGLDFVQFIALEPKGRRREDIARDWIRTLRSAIREVDPRTPVTVGMIPFGDDGGDFGGFLPGTVIPELDFVSVHIYPKSGKVDSAIRTLERLQSDKPVLVEETFVMTCSAAELEDFVQRARPLAAGFIYHYFGETPAQLRQKQRDKTMTIPEALALETLKVFEKMHGTTATISQSTPR